jgi:hypothetical protein
MEEDKSGSVGCCVSHSNPKSPIEASANWKNIPEPWSGIPHPNQ